MCTILGISIKKKLLLRSIEIDTIGLKKQQNPLSDLSFKKLSKLSMLENRSSIML